MESKPPLISTEEELYANSIQMFPGFTKWRALMGLQINSRKNLHVQFDCIVPCIKATVDHSALRHYFYHKM